VISGDGLSFAYTSQATNITPRDTNGNESDVFYSPGTPIADPAVVARLKKQIRKAKQRIKSAKRKGQQRKARKLTRKVRKLTRRLRNL